MKEDFTVIIISILNFKEGSLFTDSVLRPEKGEKEGNDLD